MIAQAAAPATSTASAVPPPPPPGSSLDLVGIIGIAGFALSVWTAVTAWQKDKREPKMQEILRLINEVKSATAILATEMQRHLCGEPNCRPKDAIYELERDVRRTKDALELQLPLATADALGREIADWWKQLSWNGFPVELVKNRFKRTDERVEAVERAQDKLNVSLSHLSTGCMGGKIKYWKKRAKDGDSLKAHS